MAADIAALEAELAEIQSPAQQTKACRKPHRRALPADLPREEVVHEPEHDHCGHCGGEFTKIGEHVSEKLDVIPMQFKVRRDLYPQYACRHCETSWLSRWRRSSMAAWSPPCCWRRSRSSSTRITFRCTARKRSSRATGSS